MQRRAATNAASPGGRQATDARHAAGDVVQTMRTPQFASMAKTARAPQSESDPLGVVKQLIRGFGAAGAATATGATTPQSLPGDRGREFYPDHSSHTRGSGKSKRNGRGKEKGHRGGVAHNRARRRRSRIAATEATRRTPREEEGQGVLAPPETGRASGANCNRAALLMVLPARRSSTAGSSTGAAQNFGRMRRPRKLGP